jgi:flagellar protein FliS
MSINKYEENRILSASPVELVGILYDAALRAASEARARLRDGDIGGRSREINRAQMILVELSNSVDCEAGGEIAKRLVVLYDYMISRLAEAHVEQQDAPLGEVEKLLGTLQEAWAQVEAETPAEQVEAAG